MDLKALCELRGVSGQEHAVREALRAALPTDVDEVREDALGNLLVGKGLALAGPTLMVDAHMDEVGLIVTGAGEEGLLRFRSVGGVDARILPGKRVRVGSSQSAQPGVIAIGPAHLSRGSQRDTLTIGDLRIDVGAQSEDEARTLQGAMVTFDTPYRESKDGIIMARALDNRIGCHLLLRALAHPVRQPLWAVFSVQEEIGLRGAAVAARALKPTIGLSLEATICDDRSAIREQRPITALGEGAVLSLVDGASLPDDRVQRRLCELAQATRIAVQWRRGGKGGNDAGAMRAEGVATASLSVPCRYLHGPRLMACRSDVESAAQLLESALAEGVRLDG